MYREKFYLTEDIPEVFKVAQDYVDKKYAKEEEIWEPIPVPMPTIRSNPNVYGPLRVTKKWYIKEKEKAMSRRAESKAEAEIEMIRLMAQRDRIRSKLSQLDPGNKKDSKKIAALNCRLNVINDYINEYKEQYDFNIEELDHGTKLGRFIGNMKRKIKKTFKKVKKFFKEHEEVLWTACTAVASLVVAFVVKLLI